MLNSEKIDIKNIFKEYSDFEKKVYADINACNTSFLKPSVVKTISSYKMPYRMQAVRAMYAWNALFPNRTITESSTFRVLELHKTFGNPIVLPVDDEAATWSELEDILGEDATDKLVAKWEEEGNKKKPKTFEEFMNANFKLSSHEFWETLSTVFNEKQITALDKMYYEDHKPLQKFGLDVIAVPMDLAKYPEELLPLVNTEQIANSVFSKGNILLESLGFIIVKSQKIQSPTNIVDI